MPQTRSQRASQSTQSTTSTELLLLGDDALRNSLTFLSVAECNRGPGAASKALCALVTPDHFTRFRGTSPYSLHIGARGVVHALATSFGTRRWPTRAMQNIGSIDGETFEVAALPAGLRVTVHRNSPHQWWDDETNEAAEVVRVYVESGPIHPDLDRHISCGRECSLGSGSYVEYELPCRFQVSHFRFSVGNCGCQRFSHWTLEAFDGEQGEWRELYLSIYPDWLSAFAIGRRPKYKTFRVSTAMSFPSTRFRIRLAHGANHFARCMHIRGLELFGTVLPPWRQAY